MGQRELVSCYEVTVRRKDGLRPASASMCRRRLHDVDSSAVKGSEQPDHVLLHSSRSGRGAKRKLEDEEDEDCELERQLLLSLSLDKLRSVQQQAEPSLHRSVLLSNTLRQIQRPPSPRVEAEPRSACKGHADSQGQQPRCEERPQAAADLHFGAFEIVNSTSCYLTDLQPTDDVFEDIDTSMCDATDFPVLGVGGHGQSGGVVDDYDLLLGAFSAARQLCFPPDLNDLDHIMEILVHS